jgi:hypothetical protein
MADNFNLRSFLTENNLTKNAQLLKEARVDGFDENQKAFQVSFVNKYGGGDSRILNAETPEQAEEVFADIFIDNPDFVQSIKSVQPYQVPVAKPQAEPQPGLEGVNYNSIQIDGIDPDDYPDFVDAYITYAEYEDGTPLTDEELVQFQEENYEIVGELIHDNQLYLEGEEESNKKSEEDLKDDDFILFPLDKSTDKYVDGGRWREKEKQTMKETKLTAKERRLVEMVQDALGIAPQAVAEEVPMAEEEMVQEKPLPKYNSIEELMKEIEHGTNEAAHKYKMDEMKRVYEALEAKVGSLEEGEHAEHIDQKAVKQMRKDIAALRKAEEKLRKEFDKKFSGKEKKETPAKEKATEALQERFDLKKFLVENKLTTNSRLAEEVDNTASGYERLHAKVDNLDRNTQVNAYQLLDFVNNLGGNAEDDMVIDAIFYAAQDNNADELISILADTMGEGGGSNDPLAFDGVFTYSDIEQALSGNEMSDDLKSQILDNDLIRNLERG